MAILRKKLTTILGTFTKTLNDLGVFITEREKDIIAHQTYIDSLGQLMNAEGKAIATAQEDIQQAKAAAEKISDLLK